MTELSVVVVHYRTPELLGPAFAALREDARAGGLAFEAVVIDNGSDAQDQAQLAALGVPVIAPGRNLGYAGGANLGLARTQAPFVVLMNPDVIVRRGCLPALLAELRRGAAAAGPRFEWDSAGRLLLPPTERRDFASALLARLAWRSASWARRARARWRRHARRHWLAPAPTPSAHLSGALLALRRDAFQRIGPFDEGFALYFEETDWLHRAVGRGCETRYVPEARAVHLYARSTAGEPRAAAWFAASARRFERRLYGPAAGLLRALDRMPLGAHAQAGGAAATQPRLELAARDREQWVEISPNPLGYPAAAERLPAGPAREWRLPDEVWRRLSPGPYAVRAVDAPGLEFHARSFLR